MDCSIQREKRGLRHFKSRAAAISTGIAAAKLNGVDPQARLDDVLARINDHNIHSLGQLLPWNWKASPATLAAS